MESFLTDKSLPIRNETLNSKSMNFSGSTIHGKNFSRDMVTGGTAMSYKR